MKEIVLSFASGFIGSVFGFVVILIAIVAYVSTGSGAQITHNCSINGYGQGECEFTNTGVSPGSLCVVTKIVNSKGESASSRMICSGRVWPDTFVARKVDIYVPRKHCDGYGTDWRTECSIDTHVVGDNSN
jgi:hypothetical protein